MDASFPVLRQHSDSDAESSSSLLGKRSYSKCVLLQEAFNATSRPEDLKTQEYLDLCYFIMRDASPEHNGILLRGNSLIEDKALSLLHSYEMNHDLATYHILNAEEMAIPILRQKYLQLFKEEP